MGHGVSKTPKTATNSKAVVKVEPGITKKQLDSTLKNHHNRLENLTTSVTNLSRKPEPTVKVKSQPAWYENPLLAPVSLGLDILFALVFGWVASELFAKNKRRRRDIEDLKSPTWKVPESGNYPPPKSSTAVAADGSALARRMAQLEDQVDQLTRKLNSTSSQPQPQEVVSVKPELGNQPQTATPVLAPLVFYVELNQTQPNPAVFQAGDKGRRTVLRLKEGQKGQFLFGIDPELSPSQLDEVLPKPAALEPFADLILKPNATRLNTSQPGQARRLPSGMFEVVQKAKIEFT